MIAFDLPIGSLVVLRQETVLPVHPDAERALPHPEIRRVLTQLTEHYNVAILGRHRATRLCELFGSEIVCLGHYGLEVLRGGRLDVAPAAAARAEILESFGGDVAREYRKVLDRHNASLRLWPNALAVDWRLSGARDRVGTIAAQIRHWARQADLHFVDSLFALDVLACEPDEEEAVAALAERVRPPALMYVHESGWRGQVLVGRLHRRGVKGASLEVAGESVVGAAETWTVEVRGVSDRALEVPQPLDRIRGVIEMLRGLAGDPSRRITGSEGVEG